jgi:hypothetical protein
VRSACSFPGQASLAIRMGSVEARWASWYEAILARHRVGMVLPSPGSWTEGGMGGTLRGTCCQMATLRALGKPGELTGDGQMDSLGDVHRLAHQTRNGAFSRA